MEGHEHCDDAYYECREIIDKCVEFIKEEMINIECKIEDAEKKMLDKNSFGAGYDCGFLEALRKIEGFIDDHA